jgi:probable rRNA maturation factor
MKLTLEINRKVSCPYSDKFFSDIVKKTIGLSRYRFLNRKKVNVSLAIIADAEMKKINFQFRKKNCSTDVLSFPNFRKKQLFETKEKDLFLGEILVSFPYIKKSAKIRNIKIENELGYVVSHGVLHCLGFAHGKEMFEIQNLAIQNKKNG